MRYRLSVFTLATLVLTSCAGLGMLLPTPTNIDIVPPAPGLAPDLAAFSGIWEGVWDGSLPSRLIVERIDATSAQVVYIWGRSTFGYQEPGWMRVKASVLPGGKITWGKSISFIFTMNKDRTIVDGERKGAGYIYTTRMEKVGQQ